MLGNSNTSWQTLPAAELLPTLSYDEPMTSTVERPRRRYPSVELSASIEGAAWGRRNAVHPDGVLAVFDDRHPQANPMRHPEAVRRTLRCGLPVTRSPDNNE